MPHFDVKDPSLPPHKKNADGGIGVYTFIRCTFLKKPTHQNVGRCEGHQTNNQENNQNQQRKTLFRRVERRYIIFGLSFKFVFHGALSSRGE
jgi:hypothetical protein